MIKVSGATAPVTAVAICAAILLAQTSLLLSLKGTADIPLSGSPSRLDYESLDFARHTLFIAHMGDSSVIAVDTVHRRVVGTVTGTPLVRGVLAVPQLGRVYAAAKGSSEIVVIDERLLRTVARTKAGDVDGLAYEPRTQRLFVSDQSGGNDVVIDTRTNRVIAKIRLGGDAGNTQFDSISHRIFVAVETLNQLVEIDPVRLVITGRYDLPGCEHSHGLAIDGNERTAYIACETNAALVKFDLQKHRITAKDSLGDGPDVLAIDPVLRRLYVASESGTVSVFSISRTRFLKLGQAFFAPHAHVVTVDPVTHEVYFPLQDAGGRPVLRIAIPR